MKIFGIGLNKTGTSTLGKCFRTLGFKHSSHRLDLIDNVKNGDLDPVFEHVDLFDSFEDWPWPLIYKQLDEKYPGSKFILTTRQNPETWFKSLKKHANRTGPTEARKLVYGHSMPHKFEQKHLSFYNTHNQNVKKYFTDRPNDFIELCWEKEDSWIKLCDFLDMDIPGKPFPHANKGYGYIRIFLHKIKSNFISRLQSSKTD